MPAALQVISGHVTAPSTTFTGWTVHSGDSLTVGNAPLNTNIRLLDAWADNQTAGTLRIRSPRLHDNVQGIRLDVLSSDVKPLLPQYAGQMLVPQDTLVVEQTGSATAGDIESGAMLLYYADLPGVAARLMSYDQVMQALRSIVTVENTLALGTSGGYSGEEAINAEFDLLKANTDYALLGYHVDAECTLVGWRGADMGNLRVAGPGDDSGRDYTRDWFVRLAQRYNLPLVPVFNSANKAALLVDGVQDENGTDVTVTTILGELGAAAAR